MYMFIKDDNIQMWQNPLWEKPKTVRKGVLCEQIAFCRLWFPLPPLFVVDGRSLEALGCCLIQTPQFSLGHSQYIATVATSVGSENAPGTSGMHQHSQIHYLDKPVVEVHQNTSRSKKHKTLRVNIQKTAMKGWTQKAEGDMGVKES